MMNTAHMLLGFLMNILQEEESEQCDIPVLSGEWWKNHSVPKRYTPYSTEKSHQVIQTSLLPPAAKGLAIPMLPIDFFFFFF